MSEIELHRITPEWAKQLLYLYTEQPIDPSAWATMKVEYAQAGFYTWMTYRHPEPYEPVPYRKSDLSTFIQYTEEPVRAQKIVDPVNHEITQMGYSHKTNTLVVWESWWVTTSRFLGDYL